MWTFRDFCSNEAFIGDTYNWPFLAYLATVCAWPMVSCVAHLFSVMSDDARHICFFVDYLRYSICGTVALHISLQYNNKVEFVSDISCATFFIRSLLKIIVSF